MDRLVDLTGRLLVYTGIHGEDIPQAEEIRKAMGVTFELSRRFNLAEMLPLPEPSSTRYCLANTGEAYIVYSPSSGGVKVDLRDAKGDLKFEWIDPINGNTVLSGTVRGGGWETFEPPFTRDATLLLYKFSDSDADTS